MDYWEAYIHSNGKLQVKNFLGKSGIETGSPFVQHYLGTVEADGRNMAIVKFTQKAVKKGYKLKLGDYVKATSDITGIDLIDLEALSYGDRVRYEPEHYKAEGKYENGMVKEVPNSAFNPNSMNYQCVRVVLNCNGEWDRFDYYTGALTHIRDLKMGWRND